MYQQKLCFVCVTRNDELKRILVEMKPVEDCEYQILSVRSLPEAAISSLDSAVIFDYSEGLPDRISLPEECHCKLILQASDLKQIAKDRSLMQAELWVIDGTLEDNETLLKSYFSQTAQQMKLHADYRKEKICMETALDSIPDLSWFKDLKGAHLMVNDAFCYAVQKTKEQIYKKGHYYVWDISKEEYDAGDYVCLESEQEVMDAGKTCLFDEKVKTKNGMRKFKTYKSPLYDVDGTLFGTCGIAQDVTEFGNLTNELMMVLESMTIAVVVENANGIILSINKKFCEYFPQYMDIEGHSFETWWEDVIRSGEITSKGSLIHVKSGAEDRYLSMDVETVYDVFDQMLGKIRLLRDVTTEYRYEQQMKQYANTDFMTGLNNRRSLFAYLGRKKYEKQLTFLTIDLDNFKSVNDRYGYHMGDIAILKAVSTINELFSDDFKARLGGDEFLVVIDHPIEREAIRQKAELFLQCLTNNLGKKKELREMTASVGIAISFGSKNKPHNIDRMMQNSDRALYSAKYAGKGSACFYDNDPSDSEKTE